MFAGASNVCRTSSLKTILQSKVLLGIIDNAAFSVPQNGNRSARRSRRAYDHLTQSVEVT